MYIKIVEQSLNEPAIFPSSMYDSNVSANSQNSCATWLHLILVFAVCTGYDPATFPVTGGYCIHFY